MHSKKNIIIMLCISLLQGMVFYGSIATLYRENAGIGIFEITIIESVSLIMSLAMELPWGLLADRIGYKTTMVVCSVLFFISKLIFWKADSFSAFLAERLLLAFVVSGLSGVDASVLYLSAGEERSQRVFGWYDAAGTAGLLLSTLLYALLVGSNYRLAAQLTVYTYGAAALLSLLLEEVRPVLKEKTSPLAAFRSSVQAFRHTRGLLPLVLCGALLGTAVQNVSVFLNQLQYVRCGMTPSVIGFCALATMAAGLCGPLSEPLTRRFREHTFGQSMLLLCVLACLALAITSSAILSVIAVTVLCGASALFMPLSATLENRMVVSDDRATALSVNALIFDGIAAAADPVIGRLAEKSLSGTMMLCAALCMGAMICFSTVAMKRHA